MLLEDNSAIETAIEQFWNDRYRNTMIRVFEAIRRRLHSGGNFIVPVIESEDDEYVFRTLEAKDGMLWLAAFTSHKEYEKGAPSQIVSYSIDKALRACLEHNAPGFVINPWDRPVMLSKEMIDMIFQAEERAKKQESQKRSKDVSSQSRIEAGPDQPEGLMIKVPPEAQIAVRSDCKTEPMPEQHADFTFERQLSTRQMTYLRRGHIPQEMEDKWFWYMEGETLYAHRSWTGNCAFILHFTPIVIKSGQLSTATPSSIPVMAFRRIWNGSTTCSIGGPDPITTIMVNGCLKQRRH